jgi:prefoldin subunit 5
VPEDDRTRRRLGDATKGRIADLASGWSVDGGEPEAAPDAMPGNAPRRKTKTLPPPPPGSQARKALEEAIIDAKTPLPIAPTRTQPPTAPPPPPPARIGGKTGPNVAIASPPPPPPPQRADRKTGPNVAIPSPPAGTLGSRSSGSVPAIPSPIPMMPSGPRSRSGPFGAKSGPTDTGTMERSGVIGAHTDLVAKSGLVAPRTHSLEIESAAERLPLRADATDVTAPPAAVPPPVPPQRAFRAPPVVDDPSETIPEDHPGAMPRLVVPVGEFDHAGTALEQDKLRIAYEQSTLKRDPASAILGLAEPSETQVKSPPVQVLLEETAQQLRRADSTDAPETIRFERGDPTDGSSNGDRGDATTVATSSPGHHSSGKLRNSAALRRKRGFGGDLRYVATVMFGVRRARRELVELEARQELRQQSRKRYLVTLGRAAVTLDHFDHPALGPARERLGGVEEERSQHAGAVAAADTELTRVRRDRDAKAKQYLVDLAALDVDLADIAKKLEPLEKEALQIGKRAAELKESLLRIEKTMAATEASLVAVKSQGVDRAGIQAELATLRADRMAVQRDEPKIAAELDELNPRIADLEARRNDARKRRTDLEQAEREDQRRAEELLAAIGAKRKVVDRAAGDAEVLRDKVLFDLGERLYVDQPEDLGPQLAPIDVIDVELGTGERRGMELREILSSVDKAKLARGIALGILIVAALGCTVTSLVYLALH